MKSVQTIQTNQQDIHKNLHRLVSKHQRHSYLKPIARHNQQAFEGLLKHLQQQGIDPGRQELILDSGCGTGMSTQYIAAQHPDAVVIGIDRSAHRLGKAQNCFPQRVFYIQTELEDFWRLLGQQDVRVVKHYLLYPNPYPKASHLKRRWHGHPVFTDLMKLGKELIVRSNWLLYLQEFEQAARLLGCVHTDLQTLLIREAMTRFEKKYANAGQALYELRIDGCRDHPLQDLVEI